MDVSIAYAIWAGLGTALITVVGIFWFKEPVNALKVVSLFIVVVGVIGLNLSDGIS
jgi:small multidrug resistance pump